MNPYEATVSNTVSRMAAWVRGILRRYRKPLFVIGAATATLVASVNAGLAPAKPAQVAAVTPR